jgi:hypothetical protein
MRMLLMVLRSDVADDEIELPVQTLQNCTEPKSNQGRTQFLRLLLRRVNDS